MRLAMRAFLALVFFSAFSAFNVAHAENVPCETALAGVAIPEELNANCYNWEGSPGAPYTRFLYPGEWGPEPTAEQIRVLENLRSAYVYTTERFSANDIGLGFGVATINVVIELDSIPGASASAHWNYGEREGEGPCWAKIYPDAWEDAPPEETKQTLAHELGHCIILKGIETPYNEGSQWWHEDGAEYFGTVAYPSANAEHPFASSYHQDQALFDPDNAYAGVLFLTHYTKKIGGGRPSAVLALLARLPAPEDWNDNYEALAGDTRLASAFHSFAKALAIGGVADTGGGGMPQPALRVLDRLTPDQTEERQTVLLDIAPWRIGATIVDIPPGWSFKFELDDGAPDDMMVSINQIGVPGSTPWTALDASPSATISSSCDDTVSAVVLPTSHAGSDGGQRATLVMTGSQLEDCEEDEEETESACSCMPHVDSCVVGEWYRDSDEVWRGYTQGYALPAGARVEQNMSSVSTLFGSDRTFSQATAYLFDIRYATERGEAKGVMRVTHAAQGNWCAKDGKMCVHATHVESGATNMAYIEAMGQRIPIPMMSAPFAEPAESRYTCSGDDLKIFVDGEIKGAPVTLEYRWKRVH